MVAASEMKRVLIVDFRGGSVVVQFWDFHELVFQLLLFLLISLEIEMGEILVLNGYKV